MGKLLLISLQCLAICFSAMAETKQGIAANEGNMSFSAKVILAIIIAVIGLSALRSYIKSDEQ